MELLGQGGLLYANYCFCFGILLGSAWVVTIEYDILGFDNVPLSVLLMSLCTDMHACCAKTLLYTLLQTVPGTSCTCMVKMPGSRKTYSCHTGVTFCTCNQHRHGITGYLVAVLIVTNTYAAGVHCLASAPRAHHGPGSAPWGALEPRLPNRHQEDLSRLHLL